MSIEQQSGPKPNRKRILNIEVDDISLDELLCRFESGVLVTPNVDHLVTLQTNREFYQAYKKADFVTVDGQIVYWAMKLLGRRVKQKISGSDFFPAFCDFHGKNAVGENPTRKIFILGGKPGVAMRAMENINARQSRQLVVAAWSPSMNFVDSTDEVDRVIRLIDQSGADTLMLGLGSPKQELWAVQNKWRFNRVTTFLCVGATIDFEAGTVSRAPGWVAKVGLEWLYRLLREPQRLWRRYLVKDPVFFWLLMKDKLGVYENPLAQ